MTNLYDKRAWARIWLVNFNFVMHRLGLAGWIDLNDMERFAERVIPIV